MNAALLIDAIVRQTTVLIATLATSSGNRAQLAHVADRVFADLVTELKEQGLGHKVIADMFGMALRTYHTRVARLADSGTDDGRSLWESVLAFIQESGAVSRARVLDRFRRDNESVVRGVLRDLVDSELVYQTGRAEHVTYRANEGAGTPDAAATARALEQLVSIAVHRRGPLDRAALGELVPADDAALNAALEHLVAQGLVRLSGDTYESETCVIPFGDPAGWEAAVFDHGNAALISLAGLERLTDVSHLSIHDNPKLAALKMLTSLVHVGGALSITQNPSLTSLSGLGKLESVTGKLTVLDSPIINFVGLDRLDHVGGLIAGQLPELQSLVGLGTLTKIGDSLQLEDLPELVSLEGLEGLETAPSLLEFADLPKLPDLSALSGMHGSEISLFVRGVGPTSLRGLEGIDELWEFGLGTVEGRHSGGTTRLSSLTGLENVKTAFSVEIVGNADLASLAGLYRLSTVNDNFEISNNPNLSDIGLSALERIDGGITIHGNTSLPSCQAEELASRIGKTCDPVVPCTGACTCEGNSGAGTCN